MSESKRFTTPYSKRINKLLKKGQPNGFTVVDLFAGCGGLALGFEAVGFKTIGYEQDPDCCRTYHANCDAQCYQVTLTPQSSLEKADVVVGGPPCQPFSVIGNQKGTLDTRDGFPSFISAVRRLKPKVWMFENVRGMLYRNRWYLDRVVDELEQLGYGIQMELFSAADFGVPQLRERLIVVGHKKEFSFPTPLKPRVTALDALGKYFEHEPEEGRYLTESMDRYVAKYERASKCITPRDLHPHRPARTLTCRNLSAATGDMMRVVVGSGRRRRLLVREAARLQSFPDWFSFQGNEESVFKQIGNAVPPLFARALAESVLHALTASPETTQLMRKSRAPRQVALL